MSGFHLYVVEYGSTGGYPAHALVSGWRGIPTRKISYCFAVARSGGRTVLIDSGFSDPNHQCRLSSTYPDATWITPTEALRRIDIQPEEVDTVVLTHKHFDHAGGIESFPDATVYLQLREFERHRSALGLDERFAFLRRATDAGLLDELRRRRERGLLELPDGTCQIAPGFRLVPAFDTHTAGSQIAYVDDVKGMTWAFPGDNVYVYENIEGIGGDGVLGPIGSMAGSAETWLYEMDTMLEVVGRDSGHVVPFHDPALWDRFDCQQFSDGLHAVELGSGKPPRK